MQLFWGMSFGPLEKRPAFEAYWQRVSDREAYRKAKAVDDAAAAELTDG
jgi:glutathione S-transferase